MSQPRVAIAHDFLTVRGGAERVVLALAQAYPAAPIYTSLYNPETTYAEFAHHDVRTGPLNVMPMFRTNHRLALPVIALGFRSMRVDADVVICSSSGFSHHVRTAGSKIVYCHTPARWLHKTDVYLRDWPRPIAAAARVLRRVSLPADRAAMRSADAIVANSATIAGEIHEAYARSARVVAPCSTLPIAHEATPIGGVEPGFVLCPSRALGYKRLDVLIEAAHRMPDRRFLHVGGGPHRGQLIADAPSNLMSFASVTDAELRWAYRNAHSVALTCAEDFGLVPLEAHAHGLMSVVPEARGLCDHPALDEGGVFYPFGSAAGLVAALAEVEAPSERTLHPERLGLKPFIEAIGEEVDRVTE